METDTPLEKKKASDRKEKEGGDAIEMASR